MYLGTSNYLGPTAYLGTTVAAPAPTVTAVVVTPAGPVDLPVGQTLQASAVVQGTNNPSQAVVWQSSDQTKATVTSGGLVQAVAAGPATITAVASDGVHKGSIVVTAVVPASSGGGLTDADRALLKTISDNTATLLADEKQIDQRLTALATNVDALAKAVAGLTTTENGEVTTLAELLTAVRTLAEQSSVSSTAIADDVREIGFDLADIRAAAVPKDVLVLATAMKLALSGNWRTIIPAPDPASTLGETKVEVTLPDGSVATQILRTDAGTNLVEVTPLVPNA